MHLCAYCARSWHFKRPGDDIQAVYHSDSLHPNNDTPGTIHSDSAAKALPMPVAASTSLG